MTNYASEDSLFYNSALLFSEENIQKLINAKIAIVGIGGIGSIIVEMLARTGIGHLKLADPDIYCKENLNRQIFATLDTIGINKAVCAKKRVLSINPNCSVEVFTEGITLENVKDFCSDSDIIIVQPDKESIKVLIHKVAKALKTPCLMASRVSINNSSRWQVMAKFWDYKTQNIPTFGQTNHPKLEQIPLNKLTENILREYDEKIKERKIKIFKEISTSKANLFKSISQEDLNERINNCNDFYNRHVCSVIANSAGCLASTAAIKYIISNKTDYLELNLWE